MAEQQSPDDVRYGFDDVVNLAHMRKVVGYVRRHMPHGGPDDDRSTPGGGTPS